MGLKAKVYQLDGWSGELDVSAQFVTEVGELLVLERDGSALAIGKREGPSHLHVESIPSPSYDGPVIRAMINRIGALELEREGPSDGE